MYSFNYSVVDGAEVISQNSIDYLGQFTTKTIGNLFEERGFHFLKDVLKQFVGKLMYTRCKLRLQLGELFLRNVEQLDGSPVTGLGQFFLRNYVGQDRNRNRRALVILVRTAHSLCVSSS